MNFKTAAQIRTEILAGFVDLKAAVANIVPAGVIVPNHQCGLCGRPASLIVGRNTGLEFIVPVQCEHFPYPKGEEPQIYVPSESTARIIDDPDFWNAQCLPPPGVQLEPRAAYRRTRKANRTLANVG